jgi:uncharacterized protein
MEEVFELAVLYFVLPTIIYFGRFRIQAFLMLWAAAAYCGWILKTQGRLDLAALHLTGLRTHIPSIFALYLSFVCITTAFVLRFSRPNLFRLVRNHRRLWALILVAYPVLSVYPQALIYRAFFFFRYHALFTSPVNLLLVSAIAFAYMHIVFRNWLALGLTVCGGLLFGLRYQQTHSLFISCFEHALYGCWIFTVGLGRSFLYRGRPPAAIPT